MTNQIICPLCGSKINHRKINHSEITHYWACENCPFVGFEFYINKNIEDLKKALNKIK